jgi:membrane-bound lytic murein transglycosylase A
VSFLSKLVVLVLLLGTVGLTAVRAETNSVPDSVGALPGWANDDLSGWLTAWKRSCQQRPWNTAGTVDRKAWEAACRDAMHRKTVTAEWVARYFHVKRFADDAFVTGYFEPTVPGSKQKSREFSVPLYRMPKTAEHVSLPRSAIDAGGLDGLGLELVWLSDAVNAFFFHIQGSGRVQFADGSSLGLAYAGNNGQAYYAIGRDLVARGEISRDAVSMQTIAAWLRSHPRDAKALMHRNPRYIYFHVRPGESPLGAQGAALTPERSLAVDPRFIPYGLPVWLDVEHPDGQPNTRLRKLVVAQDTGAAIKGDNRADFFWGAGDRAAALAGRMQSRGHLYVLWPRLAKP